MKSKNLILGAALAGVLGTMAVNSFAGTVGSLPRKFAYPLFQGATAVPITIAPISFTTAVPLSTATTYYVYVQLQNSAVFDAGYGPLAAQLVVKDPTNTLITGLTVGVPSISTDGTFVVFPVTTTTNPVPTNSTITYSAPGAAVDAQGLAVVGASVSAVVSIGGTTSLTTPGSDVDSAGSGVVATSANPTTASVIASDSAAFLAAPVTAGANENVKIDVVAGAGKVLTAPSALGTVANTVDLGAIVLTNVTGVFEADGATQYSIANVTAVAAATLQFSVTGNFNAFKGSANKVYLSAGDTCAAVTIAATTVTATAATFTNIANGASAIPRFLCAEVDTTTLIQPGQASVTNGSFTLKDTASTTTYVTTASPATLYNLGTNGSIVDTWMYFPALVTDQQTYIRIINVGTVTAQPSVAVINDSTGTVGTAATLGGPLPVGAAAIFSQAQIEAATGAIANIRPRLRITAPGQIRVQTFVVSGTSATVGDLNAAQGVSPGGSSATNGN